MTTWQLQVLRAEDLREIDEVFGTIDIRALRCRQRSTPRSDR